MANHRIITAHNIGLTQMTEGPRLYDASANVTNFGLPKTRDFVPEAKVPDFY